MKCFRTVTRIVSLILAFVLFVSGSTMASGSTGTSTGGDEKSGKLFYTTRFSPEMNQFLQDSYPTIARVIANESLGQGELMTQLSVGTPVSIDINDNFFYIPLLHDSSVVYILCIGETGDSNSPYSLTYGNLFADKLNALPTNEIYRIISSDNDIYAVSKNECILLMHGPADECKDTDGDYYSTEAGALGAFAFFDEEVLEVVNLETAIDTITIPKQSRALNEKVLSVPYVANGGKYGYCWLSATISIINYYRKTSYTPDETLHLQAGGSHLYHMLYDCPVGYLYDSREILLNPWYYIASDAPFYTYLSPSQVMAYIDSNTPVMVQHGYYNVNNTRESGHQFVLCGYSYDTYDITRITYVYVDSNSSSRVAVTYYSASGISSLATYNYNISGKPYKWDGGLKNFRTL